MALMIAIFVATLALCFANGANDVSRSIATLVGSKTTSYRAGIIWGTIWTGIGSIASLFFASEMLKTFSTWVKPEVEIDPLFPLSVAVGATIWVIAAARFGLPVSTTHSLVGAICGVATFAYGANSVAWGRINDKVVLPLIFSPVIGLVIAFLITPAIKKVFNATRELALCVVYRGNNPTEIAAMATASGQVFAIGETAKDCFCVYYPTVAKVNADRMHWLSSGLIAFSRALNDTPKIAALPILFFTMVPQAEISKLLLFTILTLAVCLGSLLNGVRVTRTMAEKITKMTDEEGLAANLTSSVLVTFASRFGLPVSTTHVTNGSIIGVGLREGGKNAISWDTVRGFLMAWVITLPSSALLAIITFFIVRALV